MLVTPALTVPFFVQLTTLRGSVLEDSVPSTAKHGTARGLPLKEVLEYLLLELDISCLRLALNTPKVTEQLMKLDEQGVCRPKSQTCHSLSFSSFATIPILMLWLWISVRLVCYRSCAFISQLHPLTCSSFLGLLHPQLSFQVKVGVMYCRAGQSTEEEMYNNEMAGPAFEEFLQLLGEKVRLKGFSKYRAQLDTKSKYYTHSGL